MSDLYWLARFDAFDTSSLGRSVWLMAMVPGELTMSGHGERGQPQGLNAPLFSTLTLRVKQGFPSGTTVASCQHDCYEVPQVQAPALVAQTLPVVSVPEPGSLLLLATGLLGLGIRARHGASSAIASSRSRSTA